jgi:hypothetical protein
LAVLTCHTVVRTILSINRPTKRGKEKSRSDGHCQREKEMDDHILACQYIFEIEPLSDTVAKERASFLVLMTLMTFHFLERLAVIFVVL